MRYCPTCRATLENRDIDGTTRLACPETGCGFVYWNNPLPVVAAILEHEDGMVLVRKTEWPPGVLGLVTGFLERDETPESGILREVEEETGLRGSVVGLVGVYSFPMRNEVIIAYHVHAKGEVTLSDELESFRFVAPDRLKGWGFGTGLAVADWVAQRQSRLSL